MRVTKFMDRIFAAGIIVGKYNVLYCWPFSGIDRWASIRFTPNNAVNR